MSIGTVDTVARAVFLEFTIPGLFEFLIKEMVDMLQGYVFGCTAFRWHMSWIRRRHGEDATQTFMAHPMGARQLGSLVSGHIVSATSKAGDLLDGCGIVR